MFNFLKQLNLRVLAIVILIVAGGLMAFLIYDLNSTENSLAQSLLEKPMQSAKANLDGFFKPAENTLRTTKQRAEQGMFDSIAPKKMNVYFASLIANFPQISSMGLAHTEGYEYDVLPDGDYWNHRIVWVDRWGNKEKWGKWQFEASNQNWNKVEEWEDSLKHDPRVRPWFKGALEKDGKEINWTEPYIYNTTFEAGMTASLKYQLPGDSLERIMAFDLTMADITSFTQKLKVSEHGKVFVLHENQKYIGLPEDKKLADKSAINEAILKHPDSIGVPVVSHALKTWNDSSHKTDAFEFQSENEYWWGKLVKYPISKDRYLVVGVVIPERDILSEVQRTKMIIIGSFLFVLLLTGFIFYSYGQTKKANVRLFEKNEEINYQKMIIETKNEEITDSIHYAQRLQAAMLPMDTEMEKHLGDHFVLYKPKDIVAGDFYWMEKVDDKVFYAAADCTGHGVPGAMVSVVCSNALTKTLLEEKITDPGKILDRCRELIIKHFAKSDEEIKDGMDISLCVWNKTTNEMQWAGANNPLWIVRKNALSEEEMKKGFATETADKMKVDVQDDCTFIEIKADKQPIGKYAKPYPFTAHTVQLEKGDCVYTFSDGYADQFGGDDGKKYKSKNFRKGLTKIFSQPMDQQIATIDSEFESWRGEMEQLDDVCVIGVRV